ncbi:GNAT family N-acetyltransferase [Altibacter sp. HG106]|uniref:GNAT family N-acetyltransferase n=1 Tax=Altibacter sp. HG106 TaxID=3023937 RepID=UPI0023506446|nr:GNAT family N-acetyltransferase [Altibacter sp. HG106]MDC7994805.1 GNAT family N-acetyltransferase [Altibacter sp. HG106]
MKAVIRDATPSDMPQVLHCIKELARFEKEPDAVAISVETLLEEGFGERPIFHCFVAERSEEIVGIALVYFRFSTWKGRTLHLEDLIVTQDQRGKGIGKALYQRVIQYAYEQGVQRLEWVVLDWNQGAIDFYEHSGATLLKDWYLAQMEPHAMKAYLDRNT